MSNPRAPRDYIAHADRLIMLAPGSLQAKSKLYVQWLNMHDVTVGVDPDDGSGTTSIVCTFEGGLAVALTIGIHDTVAYVGALAMGVCFYAVHHGFTTWETV